METKRPGKRIQANLPFMAHTLYSYCEGGFKARNKPNDLAATALPLRDPVTERGHRPWTS
jgi:hypothetical protein